MCLVNCCVVNRRHVNPTCDLILGGEQPGCKATLNELTTIVIVRSNSLLPAVVAAIPLTA